MSKATWHLHEGEWHEGIAPGDSGLKWVEVDLNTFSEQKLDKLVRKYNLHPLAVEDAVAGRERPKVEHFDDFHTFAVLHQLTIADGQMEAQQLSCFIGQQWIVILHRDASRTTEEARRRLTNRPPDDPTDLIHAVLDTLVDEYQRHADALEREVETIEEVVLEDPHADVQRELYNVKQRVSRIRRYVLPVSRLLTLIVEPGRPPFVDAEASELFRDVYDHTARMADQVRNIEDLSNAILDLIRTAQDRSANEVARRLSAWAAIIAVPTFISSVFGMNTELPGLHEWFGFQVSLALMALAAGGLFFFFRKRGWL